MSLPYDYIVKAIVVGDADVGKSSLCRRFCHREFSPTEVSTLGVEFFSQIVPLDARRSIKLNVWDTAGSEEFKTITHVYYRNTALVFLVYDSTQRRTFKSLPEYWQTVQRLCGDHVLGVLVHNKADLATSCQVPLPEARQWAQDQGLRFAVTSPKTGQGVQEVFVEAVKALEQKLNTATLPQGQPSRGIRSTREPDPFYLGELTPRMTMTDTTTSRASWCGCTLQ